jgi:predicted lysophospholipase L1 biosynthesis ABC-type transport system permease subunit
MESKHMPIRIFQKSATLAVRARTRFIVFMIIYTVLVFWLAYNIEDIFFGGGQVTNREWYLFGIAVFASIVLAILYAWILINYRKKEIATLKCIGWTNGDIRTLIVGEIIWVSLLSVLIVAEILIHYAALMTYIYEGTYTQPLLKILSVGSTILLFFFVQIVGILLMYRKILKLRPIVALRVIK